MKEKIKIEIEIGHWAKRISAAPGQAVLPNSAVQNATHVWKVWVCGRKGQLESFVQRAVFRLHQSFPTPVIVVDEPPFEIEEKAFGTFPMKIELHFNDSMAAFEYEVFLLLDRDINCRAIKSFSIANPRPPEFRDKLLLAGGVVVDSSDEASGPSDATQPQAPKVPKSSRTHSSLVRHKSKAKTTVAMGGQGVLLPDDPMFASPTSSEDLGSVQTQSPPQQPPPPAPPAQPTPPSSQQLLLPTVKTVGTRLASPSKAKLKESSGCGLSGRSSDYQRSPVKPKSLPPPPPAAAAATVKAEPIFGVDSPAQTPQVTYAEPSPRVSELRAEEPKSEKLVLKISKSPIKYSPAATVKAEPPSAPDPVGQRPLPPAIVAVVAPTSTQPAAPPAPPLSSVASTPISSIDSDPIVGTRVDTLPASVPAVVQPVPSDPPASEWPASTSEEDRRKRKKEKRKKGKEKHRYRSNGSGADSDSDERRLERRRRRHEEKERKKKRREEADVPAPVAMTTEALHQQPPLAPPPSQLRSPPSQSQLQPPPSQPQLQPPPTLEAEPPMLSPYLMPAGPKDDPELMSQASVESTGFRPQAADCAGGSADSSPFASAAALPVSAAAMAAESAAAAAAAAATPGNASAYARHPKYQWTADLGLSRADYDQRFQLCVLAASLEDPGRLERLAAVLAGSGALTARDAEYAHFDLARLEPDCVRQLRALLMPDSAS